VPVGYVVGSVGVSENSEANNLISSSGSIHVTYTLTPLTTDLIEGAFDMDRNTGSLIVARKLDREIQSEYRLEIRALDTSASNNPQSSAVTIKVEIADVNDNAPVWEVDPVSIQISEDSAPGTVFYNFSASDADTGTNGDIQYRLVKQIPAEPETFAVDPLTGGLSLLVPIDYEAISEYLIIVKATDQSSNVSERLDTSVTSHIRVVDANDNQPIFAQPTMKDTVVYLSDSASVGQLVTHVVAVDKDSGDNGLITYGIVSGNEDGRFNIDADNGFIELAKPLIGKIEPQSTTSKSFTQNSVSNLISGKYNLVVSATDHGTPQPKESRVNIKIIIQGSTNNPPRFVEAVYYANVSENIPSGSFVVRVSAKSFNNENGKSYYCY
jgi:protocadherin-16/23